LLLPLLPVCNSPVPPCQLPLLLVLTQSDMLPLVAATRCLLLLLLAAANKEN